MKKELKDSTSFFVVFEIFVPVFPILFGPDIAFAVKLGDGHNRGRRVWVGGKSGGEFAGYGRGKKRHGFGVEGCCQVTLKVFKVLRLGQRHFNPGSGKRIDAKGRVENVKGISDLGNARVFATETVPILAWPKKLFSAKLTSKSFFSLSSLPTSFS